MTYIVKIHNVDTDEIREIVIHASSQEEALSRALRRKHVIRPMLIDHDCAYRFLVIPCPL